MRLSFEYKPEEHERTYIHDILKKLPQNQEATLKFSIPENSYNEASELLRHEMNIFATDFQSNPKLYSWPLH